MSNSNYCVIMAGGIGSRFWPLSKKECPKQFLDILGVGRTLLQQTYDRFIQLMPAEQILIVSNLEYRELIAEQLPDLPEENILLEPMRRNTAPCIDYANFRIQQKDPDANIVVAPSDHLIVKEAEFLNYVQEGFDFVEKNDALLTMGIVPSRPETGYGYIKALEASGEIRSVDRFVEKPDAETAQGYVSSGDYFWNSGIFIWKTSVILEAFREHMPELVEAFQPLLSKIPEEIAMNSGPVWTIKEEIFNSIESVSVDYGIMEKAGAVKVIPADFGWADLGSWKSIDDILSGDDENNRAPQSEKAIFVDSHNCSVFSEDARISVVGLADIVVVQAGDEILVINKDASQNVRRVVDMIREK